MDLDGTTYWISTLFPGELETLTLPAPGFGDLHLSAGEVAEGQLLACTRGFAECDTGLHGTEGELDGIPIRSELFTIHATSRSTEPACQALRAAVSQIASANAELRGCLPAQPGMLLPEPLDVPGCTVSRGLLVVPWVWGPQVPHLAEKHRQTMMLQLLMLTEEEAQYAHTYGVGALQEEMVNTGINVMEWTR
ncbi:suppressor of fused domain protein [Corynebacterium uropygiale]|uniref:Suppressor of fused domain protein n=1 Tax=Corynebacterium uropygiale TaxID=1775911 RepID=A0A9X1QMK1_9CORY|nr:suppressor of fused domain protein [Corynebacterium uropygiale]MCF4005696.1 suppressor of fused domain protein [Corynebacterium uropygiale]